MATKASYLKRSSTGRYSYRRKVPVELAPYFPRTATGGVMREWKKSFHTKDPQTAQRYWVEENQRFDQAERVASAIRRGQFTNTSDHEALQIAKQLAVEAGFHPDQAPKPPVEPNDLEWEKYKAAYKLWLEWIEEQRKFIAETDAEQRIDYQKLEKDYKSGLWSEPNYETPLRTASPKSVLSLATRILEGELSAPLISTWAEATELYISVSKQSKTRDPLVQHKWEIKTRGLLKKFAASQEGPNTPLSEISRPKVRLWLLGTFRNQSTQNRYLNTLSAVINTWNRENASIQVHNPFSGLASKQKEHEQAKKRPSFKPDQFEKYIKAICSHPNEEVKLIGLLMAWTGCRTSEASGLAQRDVKLEAEVPHVIFRTNSIRRLGKGGLERAVPLAKPLYEVLSQYKGMQHDGAFFPRHGTTRGAANVSAALRYALKELKLGAKGLVPYSLRHTLKDRLGQTGLETSMIEYVLGHRSRGSSIIHQRYGTMTPPRILFDAIDRLPEVTDWGYFED